MSNKKILIVDDEVNLTKMLKLNLDETGIYDVMTLNKASQAMDSIRNFMPDVILLDIMMPEQMGNEIADKITSDPALANMKIIFLTALVTKAEAPNAGREIAGRRFLAKPVKTEALLSCIEEVLTS